MFFARIIAVAIIGLGLTACAGGNLGGPKEDTGTLVGAGAGALIGSQIGGDSRARVAGAIGGALLGGLIGGGAGTAGAGLTGNKPLVIPTESIVVFGLSQPISVTVER